jgi:hypothetical protein
MRNGLYKTLETLLPEDVLMLHGSNLPFVLYSNTKAYAFPEATH